MGKMMFDEDQNRKNSDDPKKPPGGMKMPSGTLLMWIAIIGSIMALMLLHNRMGVQNSTLSQVDFFRNMSRIRSHQGRPSITTFNRETLLKLSVPITKRRRTEAS